MMDRELHEALRGSRCIGRQLPPDEQATSAEFEMVVGNRVVAHSWRPDPTTAYYLWKARDLGRRQ